MESKNYAYSVMTCNVLTDANTRHGSKRFVNRSKSLRTLILKYMPDLIGMQELRGEMIPHLDGLMKDYEIVGEPRSLHPGDERCSILFRKDHFDLLSTETLWLSPTPSVPGSRFITALFPRIVTFAYLKDKRTGETFTFANTHLEHANPVVRHLQARILIDLLYQKKQGSFLFLTGDFNSTSDSSALKLFRFTNLRDVIGEDLGTTLRNPAVALIFRNKAIDHIFIPKEFELCDIVKIEEEPNGLAHSDHYPVIAYVGRPDGKPAA